jgi:hypothetical protein
LNVEVKKTLIHFWISVFYLPLGLEFQFYQYRKMVRGVFFAVVVRQDAMAQHLNRALYKNMVDDASGHSIPFEGGKGAFGARGG